MTPKNAKQVSVDAPDARRSILARGDQSSPFEVERDVPDRTVVSGEYAVTRPVDRAGHERAIFVTDRKELAIGREGEAGTGGLRQRWNIDTP